MALAMVSSSLVLVYPYILIYPLKRNALYLRSIPIMSMSSPSKGNPIPISADPWKPTFSAFSKLALMTLALGLISKTTEKQSRSSVLRTTRAGARLRGWWKSVGPHEIVGVGPYKNPQAHRHQVSWTRFGPGSGWTSGVLGPKRDRLSLPSHRREQMSVVSSLGSMSSAFSSDVVDPEVALICKQRKHRNKRT